MFHTKASSSCLYITSQPKHRQVVHDTQSIVKLFVHHTQSIVKLLVHHTQSIVKLFAHHTQSRSWTCLYITPKADRQIVCTLHLEHRKAVCTSHQKHRQFVSTAHPKHCQGWSCLEIRVQWSGAASDASMRIIKLSLNPSVWTHDRFIAIALNLFFSYSSDCSYSTSPPPPPTCPWFSFSRTSISASTPSYGRQNNRHVNFGPLNERRRNYLREAVGGEHPQ